MKILWLTNIPSPYRVNFFNKLGQKCKLTVLFEKEASSERDKSWKNFQANYFTAVFLKGKDFGVAEAICPSVIKYLNKQYDHIVVTNYSDPTGMIAIIYMKLRGIAYEIEGDGAFPNKSSFLKFYIKKFFLSGAKLYFSTAKLHDEYYMLNGVQKEKIVRYPFTSVAEQDILDNPITLEEKQEIRTRLNIIEKYMILAVGQFIPRKGYDTLIKATAYLDADFGVYIIGGDVPEEYILMSEKLNCKNIYFIGFKNPDELNEYYKAADIFVHPTREDIWGLVVNEAMAKGVPVITTDRCVAGMELLTEQTGAIIPPNNEKLLGETIKSVINQKKDETEILLKIRQYTLEKMVEKHLAVWEGESGNREDLEWGK